jgi:hypothetical protein
MITVQLHFQDVQMNQMKLVPAMLSERRTTAGASNQSTQLGVSCFEGWPTKQASTQLGFRASTALSH